jgi:hypothetical protein
MTATRPIARLELDPAKIRHVIDSAVVVTTEVVNFNFRSLESANALEADELSDPPLFTFQAGNLTDEQRRSAIENWVLAKAFQELLRAVRHALEIAHVFTSLLGKSHAVRSDTVVADFLRPFEAKAASLRFPQLLDDVNERLATKLAFASSYRSLQSARNCLEHRAGIVGLPETRGTEHFEFSVPRMKVFYLLIGSEVEFEMV